MKTISKLAAIAAFSAFSILPVVQAQITKEIKKEEKGNIYLSYCSHYGAGVSYSFQSCVNSNFSSVSREIGGYFSYCTNFGNEVDYGFTSCVNSGFREAQRQLNNNVWLQDCFNFDRTTLDFSFVSCVNSNFNQLQREIGKIEQ